MRGGAPTSSPCGISPSPSRHGEEFTNPGSSPEPPRRVYWGLVSETPAPLASSSHGYQQVGLVSGAQSPIPTRTHLRSTRPGVAQEPEDPLITGEVPRPEGLCPGNPGQGPDELLGNHKDLGFHSERTGKSGVGSET